MTKQINIFSLFVFLFLNLNAQTSLETEKIINAKDYGIYPNTFENIAPLLNKMVVEIAHFPLVKLVFEKGRYDIWPESSPKREYFISNTSTERECPSKIKTIALLFENFKDIVIEGNGALFMIHGKMINFAFDHCENIKIQNISFDYERPTMSELTFDEVTDRMIIAIINPSSTYAVIDNKLKFYGEGWTMKHDHTILIDPELFAFYYSKFSPLRKSKATELAPFKIKFEGDYSRFKFKKGQVLTVRDPIRDQVGAFIAYSKNVVLQNVQMHYMHGMGIINQFNENVTLDKVIVKPRKETGRKIAAFADCFHFSGCKGQIIIENCETGGGHDDPVNVHGTHLKITKRVSEDKINVRFMHGQTYGLDAFFRGDTLDFVHAKSLQIYGTAQVKEVKKINDRDLQLTLTNTIPKGFKEGDVVENVTWTPSVIIRNNYFSGTNTRGVLLTTRKKAVIENNTFFRTGMHAILIANDASSWYESGSVRDVTIRGNRFVDCAYNQVPNNYIINIWPENHKMIPDYYVHKNITIENNIFETFDTPILRAKSTSGLIFRNNKIVHTDTFTNEKGGKPSFNFVQCKNVEIDLHKSDKGKFDKIQTKNMETGDIKVEEK